MKQLILGLILAIATSIFTLFITSALIIPQALADKRIGQATEAYSDFVSAFVRLVGVQSAASAAKMSVQAQTDESDPEEVSWVKDQNRKLRAESVDAEIEYFSARARIAAYGDPQTIRFVSEIKGQLNKENKRKVIDALKAMRAHIGADGVDDAYLQKILFGNGGT